MTEKIIMGAFVLVIVGLAIYLVGSIIVAVIYHDKAMKKIEADGELFKSGIKKIINGNKDTLTKEEIEVVADISPQMFL